jgi:hypothetical protein
MLLTVALCLVVAPALLAQEPAEPPAGQAPGAAARGQAQAPPEPRPYDRVITKDAKSKPGIFTVHQVGARWYYEIPKSELNKEFLLVSQVARTTEGVGYGGSALGNRVVRWERNNNRVLLRDIRYNVVADPKEPIAMAVKAANNDAIIRSFNVEAFGKDDSVVIDVGALFTSDIYELSARQFLRASSLDASRTFIERISPYPTNIEVEATHTYTAAAPSAAGGAAPTPSPIGVGGMRPGSATVVVHYSMVKLPEQPMVPRLFDERVGYFSVRKMDYGRDEQRAPERTYVTRYRLEKKDPKADISEPVKPIVYYVDPATPAKWREWVKRGIEDWQPAFEQAGFRKAIIAKDAPTPAEDPEWSPEDARYSVIRWLPSTTENAMGPHIHDPRTGEILEADVSVYHNVMNLARAWYFVQASPLDKRAQKLPLPDDLEGRLIEYVVAHEVGHTLGFQHNFKASSMYTLAQVRDRDWVHKMGHTPSIMDYSRFNYVAQPEDEINPADLIPIIGPYDKWATMWGYKPVPGTKTPDDEKATLDQWAREQDKTPWLRFNTAGTQNADPGEQSEAVGDADAIQATTLGLKNLKRVMDYLLPATTTEKGDPYDDLTEFYGRVLSQWSLEMGHVANIVGGFDTQQKHIGQEGVRFTPIPRARQAAAVKFLSDNAFTTPAFLIRPEILRRMEPAGEVERIRRTQRAILNNVLSPNRLARLVEQETFDAKTTYLPTDFLADVRKGVFRDLEGTGPVKVDAYRRNLQRSYLEIMDDRLNRAAAAPTGGGAAGAVSAAATTEDVRPFFRGELQALSASVAAAVARATDRETRLHLEDVKDRIGKILDPKFAPPAAPAAATAGRPGLDSFEEWLHPTTCWPDYIIK